MPLPRWFFAVSWMAAGAATLAAGLGGWQALHRDPSLAAVGAALLKVDLPKPLLDDRDEFEADSRLRLEAHLRTQAALLLSPNVLSAAALSDRVKALPQVAGKADPVEWLVGALQVKELPGTTLLSVSMPGESRVVQAAIVNAVVDEYLANQTIWTSGASKVRSEHASTALARYRADLAVKRRAAREAAADPERLAALRDEIGVLEELARRAALEVERIRLEQGAPESVQVVAYARP